MRIQTLRCQTKTQLLFFTLGLLTLLCTLPARAAVVAEVSPNPVTAGQPVQLTVKADGNTTGQPDFSALNANFRIINQQSGSEFRIVNGQSASSRTWTLTLIPISTGTVLIPSFVVGNEASQAINLRVQAAPKAGTNASDLFMETGLSKPVVHVQEEVIYTLRLFYARQMANGNLPPPSPVATVVESLGDSREYQMNRNGRNYNVMEWQYAMYPERSGELTIPGPAFSGEFVVGRGGFGGMFQQTQPAYAVAPEQILTVEPAPPQQGQWLPARRVTVNAVWPSGRPALRVGEPITWSVTAQIHGQLHTQISDDLLEVQPDENFQVYGQAVERKSTASSQGVVTTLTRELTLVPKREGNLPTPTLEIPWWHTADDQPRTAKLPVETLNVAPALLRNMQDDMADNQPDMPEEPLQQIGEGSSAISPTAQGAGLWPWLSLALLALWLMTLALWWRSRREPTKQIVQQSDTSHSAAQHRKALKQAIASAEPKAARAALQAWATHEFPQISAPLTALSESDQAFADALAKLDSALYGTVESEWSDPELYRLALAAAEKIQQPPNQRDKDRLPELYG